MHVDNVGTLDMPKLFIAVNFEGLYLHSFIISI